MLEEKRRQINTIFEEIDSPNYKQIDQEYSNKQHYDHKTNIDYLVDRVLEKSDILSFKEKTKSHHNRFNSHKINRKSIKIANKKIIAILLSIILLSVAFLPIITSINSNDPLADITVINVYSFPTVGSQWTVMFTTLGRGNLTITAVNGTTWNDTSKGNDLKFLELKCGNETLEYEWVNNSVSIENYSSNEIGFETSKVLTVGRHTLMFQFGNDVAYAYNDASNWWNANWSYRKLITINSSQVAGDLTNFPILINITDTDLRDDAQEDGDDILFVLYSDNSTKLNHEIELFNGATGELVAWVNVTSLSSSADTKIWMYYGNSTCSSQETMTGTWDNNYVMVQHLNETSGTHYDSTQYGNNGIASVTTQGSASGKIDGADEFDGNTNYVNVTTSNWDVNNGTVELWCYANGFSASHHYFFGHTTIPAWNNRIQLYTDDAAGNLDLGLGDNHTKATNIQDLDTTTWYYIVLTWDGTNYEVYVNGIPKANGAYSGLSSLSTYADIGNDGNAGDRSEALNGTCDEVRISTITRNIDWINTTYNTTNNPSTFLSLGSEQNVTETSVDMISPYDVGALPLNITATGNSNLDNVTLYYRWSYTNWTSNWTTITYDDFESGFENYTDGGGDCDLYTGGVYAHQGSNAANIQDNSGDASSFYHTTGIDVDTPGYTSIKVDFWFTASTGGGGWTNGEDWFVEYYNGSAWNNVATYVYPADFTVGPFYHETVWINETDDAFPSNMQMKFRCDASGNNDDIYIDQIYVNATPNYVNWTAWTNDSNPDKSYPWSWDFDFPNGTGYYEFYSIGKKAGASDETAPATADTICYYNPSINYAPTIDLISPANGGTGIDLQPTCSIWANDSDGDTLTVYWYENTTDSWVLRNTNNSVTAGSIVSYSYSEFNNYATTYWWKVEVNDTQVNATAIYYFTTKPITTSVDPITPYEIKISPHAINATGTSDLNNVTLYYRWSDNNFTGDQWATLTYDDFEAGFGNYTDGGADCELYTGGTYAHQGSNAADIQDDSGDASSFYHTPGIDVHNPEYKSIKVDFWFRAEGMDDGHDFFVEYFDGGGWNTVATYVAGTDFVNSQFYHKTVWINETSYTFPSNMQIKFRCDALNNNNDVYIDQIYVNATSNNTNWTKWSNINNPDTFYPWNWTFNFPYGKGYYEFYSIGRKTGSPDETSPASKDAACYYPPITPVINSYDLRNVTGSKLNNATGLLDVNREYYFTINVTDANSWTDIDYINISAWFDNGSESTTYNNSGNMGGNLNMYLQYANTSGSASWNMIWPDDEAQIVLVNCTETIINQTTRVINISFIPNSQVRWGPGDGAWDATQNVTNDLNSWNFNITVLDLDDLRAWKVDEYGVYPYTSLLPNSDWVDVVALPGQNDDSSIVTITYSSNYDFNMSIYFEENLTNNMWGSTIPIANNITIKADADLNDDITSDKVFKGIGEGNAIDIINVSGLFSPNNVSQTVDVQFNVYIPFGTLWGKYTAIVASKIFHV